MTDMQMDFDRLFRLRLVVARFGEMDVAKWWNTHGQLGRLGSLAVRRGFPRTHYFAQARSVFAVAAQRCREVFDPPQSVTLWQLPEAVEEEFNVHWERWLDHADEWRPFFLELEALKETDLKAALCSFPAETVTSHYSRLDLRVENLVHWRFRTPVWIIHEATGPIPCRFVVHSHKGSDD
jgi:hypothetical protein